MEINISDVQYMGQNIAGWDNIIELISFIASILTIIGVIFPIIKMILQRVAVKPKNWKDRKAIRYCIINPINESENNTAMIISFFIELVKIIIPIIILLMTVYICLFWLNYNDFKDNVRAYLLILTEINTCILCEFISAKKQSKTCRIPWEIIDVIFLDFFILEYVVEYGVQHGVEIMVVLMTIICACNFIIIELIFILNRNDNKNRSGVSVLTKGTRLFCGLVYIVLLMYFITSESLAAYGKPVTLGFIIVWVASCCVEAKVNIDIKVEFEIDMGQDIEVTQKTIYQYECGKVKYTLANGCTKIIDSDAIQSINYIIENSIWDAIWDIAKNVIGKSRMVKVTCLLENEKVLYFDGYNFINDLWVRFYKLNENEREIKIINSKKVKKIVIEHL